MGNIDTKSIWKATLPLACAALLMAALAGCSAPQTAASSSSASSAASSASASSAADAQNEITVSVTVTEDVAGANLQETPLQFAEETVSVQCPSDTNAIEAVRGIDREVATETTEEGVFVTSIGGLANGDAGEGSRWTYELNGVEQTEPPSECALADGDQLTFRFVAGGPVPDQDGDTAA